MKLRWMTLILVGAGLGAGWMFLGRVPAVPGLAGMRPAASYAAAVARIDSIRALEGPEINPECHTRVLGPGQRTERVLVIFHGFTNCPKQFDPMARDFVRLGYNVYVPLLPRHGMADRMTEELSRLTAAELARAGEDAVAIAAGLGEVACAVLLAPSFAPRDLPAPAASRLTGLLLAIPNFYVWWDSKHRAALPGPKQCYPRFASHALAEVYRLGLSLLAEAERARPKAKAAIIITSRSDEGVNGELISDLARRWRRRGTEVTTYEFPESLDVRHDMIDPEQTYQRVAITYPVIESLVVRCSGR